MKNLPLTSLRALAAVYETGGIRPASRALGIAHSAISHHLAELEAWLGTPLLIKSGGRRKLEFTPEGDLLGKQALNALHSLDSSVTAVRETRHGNTVVVTTTPSFAVRWLLPRLPLFQDAHRSIVVSVVVEQRPKKLAEEGADISIRMGLKPNDGDAEALMDDSLFPVASPSLLARSKGTKENLAKLPLIHDRDPHTPWKLWKDSFGPADLFTTKGARFTSSDLVLRAAEEGIGVALGRGRLMEDSIKCGTLVRLFDNLELHVPDAYWLVLGPGRRRSAVAKFADWLRQMAKEQAEASARHTA